MRGPDLDSKAPVRSSLVRVLLSGDMVLHISASCITGAPLSAWISPWSNLLLTSASPHAHCPQDTPKSPIRTAMAGVTLVHHARYHFSWPGPHLHRLGMLNGFVFFCVLVVGMGMYFWTHTLNHTIDPVLSRYHNRLPDIFHHYSCHALSFASAWLFRDISACGISSFRLCAYSQSSCSPS